MAMMMVVQRIRSTGDGYGDCGGMQRGGLEIGMTKRERESPTAQARGMIVRGIRFYGDHQRGVERLLRI